MNESMKRSENVIIFGVPFHQASEIQRQQNTHKKNVAM